MRFAYDAEVDALYISVAAGDWARTVVIEEGTHVDVGAGQDLIGIEVLSPRRPWPLGEILQRWDVAAGDAAMLVGCYPCAYSFSVSVPAPAQG